MVGAKWLGQKAYPHRRRFAKPNQTLATVAARGAGSSTEGALGATVAASMRLDDLCSMALATASVTLGRLVPAEALAEPVLASGLAAASLRLSRAPAEEALMETPAKDAGWALAGASFSMSAEAG